MWLQLRSAPGVSVYTKGHARLREEAHAWREGSRPPTAVYLVTQPGCRGQMDARCTFM